MHILDYMHARFYGAGMERFWSVDPITTDYLRPQGWNRYTYDVSNPTNYVDPDGRCSFKLADGSTYNDDSTECIEVSAPHWSAAELRERGEDELARERNEFLEGLKQQSSELQQSTQLAWKDFKNEFKNGGCVAVFIDASVDALNPITPSITTVAEPAAITAATLKYNAALRYAASQPNFLGGTGLVYPMKSSVVRSMLADADAYIASGALLNLDLAIGKGLYDELNGIADGSCQ